MPSQYRRNHYVPQWYQQRFLKEGQTRGFYLDLRPEVVAGKGYSYTRSSLLRWGPKRCFVEDDLYTVSWGGLENRDIEKFFFGPIDDGGKAAVEFFSNFSISGGAEDAFNTLVPYMSVQKLRTIRGLGWLKRRARLGSRNLNLLLLQKVRNIYCTIWSEAVWQIADASRSDTKFIISDHPVVVYNRECFPGSNWYAGFNEPDIRFVATHTYFPLSLDKILILTNLSWVRDPFQRATNVRPNHEYFRSGALFSLLDVQIDRFLSEEEVREINYVTKRSARRYIYAADEEWLHPEDHLRSTHWRKLGDGYLFMPDPRHIHGGGEMVVGFEGGGGAAWSEYGHRPWQAGYKDQARSDREWDAMNKFKAEWAAQFGPEYRGVTHNLLSGGVEPRRSMGLEYYERECARDRVYSKEKGERARRRRLRR